MKKSVFIHFVTIFASLAVSSWLALSLLSKREEIARADGSLSKTPLCGLNKFVSDVQWMLFIHYCGSIYSVTQDNADDVYARLDSILRNDPDFEKAYYLGGLMLSVQAPLKSADILVRGARNKRLSSSWRIPFLAGYVLAHNVKDKDMPGRLKKAEEMYRLAIRHSSESLPHIVSACLRTRARMIKRAGVWRDIPVSTEPQAFLCGCFDEWRKLNPSSIFDTSGSPIDCIWHSSDEADALLLNALQCAKADAPADKNVSKTIRFILKRAFAGKHLCPRCLTPYCSGDKFCSHCGAKVEIYGVCPDCGAVLKGDYCSKCGRRVKK